MALLIQNDGRDALTSFLEHHLEKDLLRFTTAGSVDDGKSTLIGRLLHDSKAVYEDQLASVRNSRFNRSGGPIDFALLTDGLRAEREQGITIDVAYRYFETPARKFIIADTPGHEQYTRNMATGASTADLAVILVDASRGVLSQTRRHAYLASLLGIPNVVAAINKMDLLDNREDVFLESQDQFLSLARQLGIESVVCIPISALVGDNVVKRANRMPWYKGPTLLEHLETVPARANASGGAVRFPVQYVLRPDASFRGFAGQVAGGTIRPGSEVLALPSRQQTRVRSIVTYDGEEQEAFAPTCVTLTLEDEIDLSRGDMLVSPEEPPCISRTFEAMVVWFHSEPLVLGRTYLIKHNVRASRAKAMKIYFRVNMHTLEKEAARELKMNDIASVEFEAASPLFFDPYARNRATGSLILIDPLTNATVAAAMIEKDLAAISESPAEAATERVAWDTPVTADNRYQRHGHMPALILLQDRPRLAVYLERALFSQGFEVLLLSTADVPVAHLQTALRFARSAGLVLIWSAESLEDQEIPNEAVATQERFEFVFDLAKEDLPEDDAEAVAAVVSLLSPLRRSRQ
jgi:bifunctional enzyme CysN/CysC/sulfate adenylyltransferase subunit 1